MRTPLILKCQICNHIGHEEEMFRCHMCFRVLCNIHAIETNITECEDCTVRSQLRE